MKEGYSGFQELASKQATRRYVGRKANSGLVYLASLLEV